MKIEAESPDAYLDQLPEDRKEAIQKLREVISENLPEGFTETMNYGMIGYVVPHSVYPQGYHCDTSQPLPFINIASQKNYIALYHMGLYADPEVLDWFQKQYAQVSKTRLDMGKSCIRFKKPEQIPYELLGKLAGKMSVEQWINLYENSLKK
jgi:uncharacterized protein YdhG (YjbR/CyaY superfamily)